MGHSLVGGGAAVAIRSTRLAVTPEARPGLVDVLLREQQTLTAVERFSAHHDAHAAPAQAKYYRALMPAAPPGAGQQYAFEVDLDACTGCKACVAGCHSLNGLDGPEIWRTVGLLHGGSAEAPVQRTVTTACHHCVDPGCLSGCPVNAYEKDPVTGIVKHLDDQCIGCQYCTLMCPYDAPKYSVSRGIVRKCDMCSSRLSVGEAPACVQACPNGAIAIRVVDQVDAIRTARTAQFLPGAPAPDHIVPTTVYRSAGPRVDNLLAADFYRSSPEHAHPPLVIMLTLTQLSVGAFLVNALAGRLSGTPKHPMAQALFALTVACVALGASLFHLGRPQHFYRAVLGWRTSWLSREILAFGLFAKLAALHALALAVPLLPPLSWLSFLPPLLPIIEGMTTAVGVAGVVCSVMVYAATRRPHWAARYTGPRFAFTVLVLGSAAVTGVALVAATLRKELTGAMRPLLFALAIATSAKLLFEVAFLRHRRARTHTVLRRMATLMTSDLAPVTLGRFITALLGGVLIPVALLCGAADLRGGGYAPVAAVATVSMFVLLLAAELGDRYLFFAAAPASRMPGGLR